MIRLGNMLPQGFLIGIMDLVDQIGPDKTSEWLTGIGEKLGETQGSGLEGVPEGDLNYLPMCPFYDELIRFIDLFGDRPEEFKRVTEYVKEHEASNKEKVESPAVANTLCLLHHGYRKKRAELAGAGILHLACRCSIPEVPTAYNREAIEKAGVTKEDVDRILEKGVCVFKFIKME